MIISEVKLAGQRDATCSSYYNLQCWDSFPCKSTLFIKIYFCVLCGFYWLLNYMWLPIWNHTRQLHGLNISWACSIDLLLYIWKLSISLLWHNFSIFVTKYQEQHMVSCRPKIYIFVTRYWTIKLSSKVAVSFYELNISQCSIFMNIFPMFHIHASISWFPCPEF